VTGAVDAYLRPMESWSKSTPALRTILQKIFISVQQAASGLDEVWGMGARLLPGYADALIETAVCLNAAHTAHALRRGIESAGHKNTEVLFGVYNLFTFQVCMPNDPFAPASDESVRLAPAPSNPSEFRTLAVQMAEILRPMARSPLPK